MTESYIPDKDALPKAPISRLQPRLEDIGFGIEEYSRLSLAAAGRR